MNYSSDTIQKTFMYTYIPQIQLYLNIILCVYVILM